MVTAMFLYIVMVYLGVAAYIATRPAAPRSTPQYVVRTTWTDKQHITESYLDAWDWAKAYRNVDCKVWINDDLAYEPPPPPKPYVIKLNRPPKVYPEGVRVISTRWQKLKALEAIQARQAV